MAGLGLESTASFRGCLTETANAKGAGEMEAGETETETENEPQTNGRPHHAAPIPKNGGAKK